MIRYQDGDFAVRDSILEDILILRKTMRQEDRDEVFMAFGQSPEDALALGYAVSDISHTLLYKDNPVAMFGVFDTADPAKGTIWFLGSGEFQKSTRKFLKACKIFIQGMLTMYEVLENYVDARYAKSLRWLEWLGAEIGKAQPYGINNAPFHLITFRRSI